MAVRTVVMGDPQATNTVLYTWSGLTNASSDTGSPVELYDHADASVQVGGTLGAGGTVIIEGSNDGVTYATLNNVQATPLSLTAAGLSQVAEVCRFIRPRISAGDGTTSMTITLYGRRGR